MGFGCQKRTDKRHHADVRGNTLKTACLVNNYNYASYVGFAVESAFEQTAAFDQVIVVDDCSTDDSADVLAALQSKYPSLIVLHHTENRGQLAAFESGIAATACDVLFFLDADDVYAPNYLATARKIFIEKSDCDFLFCAHKEFSDSPGCSFVADEQPQGAITCEGRSVLRTLLSTPPLFIGAPTSCLSMRRNVAAALFPYHWPRDWVTRADEVLVIGASLSGARKFRLSTPLIGYRLHGKNDYFGNKKWLTPDSQYTYVVARTKLLAFLCDRFGISKEIRKLAFLEFRTMPTPSVQMYRDYCKWIFRHGVPVSTSRVRCFLGMTKWFVNAKYQAMRNSR